MPARRERSDDDVADGAESLPVLDLDDPELGIRPEDRFAAIPPGPRLVPRRVHDESTRAPVLLLAGLVALFLIGSWLGGIGSDERSPTEGGSLPVLDQVTGTTLLLVGDESAAVIDVGRNGGIPADGPGARALVRASSARSRVVPSATAGRAWVVTAPAPGSATAREVDLTDGSTAREVQVDGFVVGAAAGGLVVERDATLVLVGAEGSPDRVLARDSRFLGASETVVATTPASCPGRSCPARLHDVTTGAVREEVPVELSAGGTEFGSLSPDGRVLAVVRSDGVETHGVLVDLELGSTTPFRARGVGRDTIGPAALAWSADAAWLVVATERDNLDVVATGGGTTYRVDADLPPFTAILTR